MQLMQKFSDLYKNLSMNSVESLHEVYHQDIRFKDPVGEHKGMASIKAYFANLLATTEKCSFEIHQICQGADTTMVSWTMTLEHPKLNSGKAYSMDGVSELHLKDDRVVYQRDYYDMGEMIYENVPLLKQIIRFIKNKMRASH